ncbi:MAG: PIG-L family deacetylase [Actinobacteria bacterium]|nr:MAG: PIG-L family deacetylase [Actinomycetota bacterium]
MGRLLVIAPHPDDEVLGAGATMARFSEEGHEVYVCIVTRGQPPMFDEASVERVRREAVQADRSLGVRKTIFLDGFPAALLDTIPHSRLNAALAEVVEDVDPEVLLIPHAGDLHMDHRLVFESALVAVRPTARPSPRSVLAYETLSETDWKAPRVGPSFEPTTHVEVGPYLERKLEAMRIFESQVKDFPHPRSLGSLRALARMRGGSVGFEAAEAFMMVREVRPLAD